MFKRVILILAGIFLIFVEISNGAIIIGNNFDFQLISKEIRIIEDSTLSLFYSYSHLQKYKRSSNRINENISIVYSKSRWWMLFSIVVSTGALSTLYFGLPHPHINNIEFTYIIDYPVIQRAGDKLPLKERPLLSKNFTFPINFSHFQTK